MGQKFFVDAELYCDLKKAGHSDNVEDTVNYALVYDLIKTNFLGKKYNLLEKLAENISRDILRNFPFVREIKLKIKKPGAPVEGAYEYFGIEITRKQNE